MSSSSSDPPSNVNSWTSSEENDYSFTTSSTPTSSSSLTSSSHSFGSPHSTTKNDPKKSPHIPLFGLDEKECGNIIELWRGNDHYEEFPSNMIVCPLEHEELMAFYQVDPSMHPTYNAQVEEMKAKLKSPPTNIKLPKSLTPKQKKMKLSPKEVGGVGWGGLRLEWSGLEWVGLMWGWVGVGWGWSGVE